MNQGTCPIHTEYIASDQVVRPNDTGVTESLSLSQGYSISKSCSTEYRESYKDSLHEILISKTKYIDDLMDTITQKSRSY